jgi:hypothetical protein
MRDTPIVTKLVERHVRECSPCGICTGSTKKEGTIWCEGIEPDTGWDFLVCNDCLRAGNIDERLRQRAAHFDAMAALARSMIGRVKVPSYQAFLDREREYEEALLAAIVARLNGRD